MPHAHRGSVATPPRQPPGPPAHNRLGGNGQGGFWSSRLGSALLLSLLLIAALGAPAAIAGFVYGTIERPLTAGLATAGVLLVLYRHRTAALRQPNTLYGPMIYVGIAGGVLGEALTYVAFSLPPGAPHSVPWGVLFALAIGGAIGVLIALAGFLLLGGLLAGSIIPLIAKGLFGRAA
jgi:hypothetical protein